MAGSADQPLLPESAVQSDSSGAFVMVVNQNNEVERRPVTLGEISERGIAIASGLSGNERVVRSAGAFLTPGEKVKPVRAASRQGEKRPMRNISAWSLRNPVQPRVLFFLLTRSEERRVGTACVRTGSSRWWE